jgi:hypothetical protein
VDCRPWFYARQAPSTIDTITGLVNKVVVRSTKGEQVQIRVPEESEPIPSSDQEHGNLRSFLSSYQLVAEQRGTLFEAMDLFMSSHQASEQNSSLWA